MKKIILSLILLFPLSFGFFFHVGQAGVDEAGVEAKKHISEKEAKEIALKKVNGEIMSCVLQEDDGKSVYEVKVKSSETIYEIEIDAKTGKVLEVEKEGSRDGDDDDHKDDDHDHDDDDHDDDDDDRYDD